MDLLIYFGRPVLVILACMATVRLAGTMTWRLDWMTRSTGRWLDWWSFVVFAIAAMLGTLAWIMKTGSVLNFADWVWPFSIGLMALDGWPTTGDTIMVLSITATQNGVLYCLLAAIFRFTFERLAKARTVRKPLDRRPLT
ncbi:MAG: hypothetical protein WBA09_17600 [Candidatus Acidiferrum sp.]